MTNIYDKLQAEKRHVRHWLHLIITLLTCGVWFPVWVFLWVRAKQHNALIDIKLQGALAATAMYQRGNE